MHKALGTSILIMSFTALSGVIGHASFGNVNILTGITLAVSAIPTGIMTNDTCGTYTLTDSGIQGSDGAMALCWGK